MSKKMTEFQRSILIAVPKGLNQMMSTWEIAQEAFPKRWRNPASRGALVGQIDKAGRKLKKCLVRLDPKNEHDDATFAVNKFMRSALKMSLQDLLARGSMVVGISGDESTKANPIYHLKHRSSEDNESLCGKEVSSGPTLEDQLARHSDSKICPHCEVIVRFDFEHYAPVEPPTQLERLELRSTNRPIETIKFLDDKGELNMSPPYQRGVVWSTKRQANLIRSILLGIPIPAIVLNDRLSAGWDLQEHGTSEATAYVVIDGKQRCTSILRFLNNQLQVPASWLGLRGDLAVYGDMALSDRRRLKNQAIPFVEGQLKTLAHEAEVYELLNYGGVPQGEEDTED